MPLPMPEPRTCRSPRGRRVGVLLAAIALVLATGLWWWHRPPPPAAPRVLLPIIEDGKWGMIDAETGAVVIPPTWEELWVPGEGMNSCPPLAEIEAEEEDSDYDPSALSLSDWFARFMDAGPERRLQPFSIVVGAQTAKRWGLVLRFPYVEKRDRRRETMLTADNLEIGTLRPDGYCTFNSHWLVETTASGRRTLRSLANLRPRSVPAGVALGALGETLWRIDPAAGVATMTEPQDTWTVPFPPPPAVDAPAIAGATLIHWRYDAPPRSGSPANPPLRFVPIDLAVAGYARGGQFQVTGRDFNDPLALADRLRGRAWVTTEVPTNHHSFHATISWRRDGRTTTEPVPYDAVWPGPSAPDGTPVWYGMRQGWLVRLSPDGPQPLVEIGPALQLTPDRYCVVDHWPGTGLSFTTYTRFVPVSERIASTIVVGERIAERPDGLGGWSDRFYMQNGSDLFEVLPGGETRRFGPPLEAGEYFVGAQAHGDRISLVVVQRVPGASWFAVQQMRVADYDRDGRLLATRSHPITGTCGLEICEGGVYALRHAIEATYFRKGVKWVELLAPQLQPYLPEGVECLKVVVTGTTADAPGDWVLWLRRDGDHYLGDLHGNRLLDLPDTDLNGVQQFQSAPTYWALDREDGREILDERGRTVQKGARFAWPVRRIGDHWVHMDIEGSISFWGDQVPSELNVGFQRIRQVTDTVVLVESSDEARYLRLPDLKEIWRSKPGYRVRINRFNPLQ